MSNPNPSLTPEEQQNQLNGYTRFDYLQDQIDTLRKSYLESIVSLQEQINDLCQKTLPSIRSELELMKNHEMEQIDDIKNKYQELGHDTAVVFKYVFKDGKLIERIENIEKILKITSI